MKKIVVCLRQGLDGEISPFDASAYEAALRIDNAEVTLLSMAAASSKDFLLNLTRLGAKRAVLLCDRAFAGADTLATAYTLSLAIKRLSPDIVMCGRQTLIGDTGQTGAMLSAFWGVPLITGAMQIEGIDENHLKIVTRDQGEIIQATPTVICMEKSYALRLPRLRSRLGEVEVMSAEDIGADAKKCGFSGSPTRVLASFENQSGKRKCQFISRDQLMDVVKKSLDKKSDRESFVPQGGERLFRVCIVGEAPRKYAESVSDDVSVIPLSDEDGVIEAIRKLDPSTVLWGTDDCSKRLASRVAARLGLGLCADCTALGCEDGQLIMYRPALSGSVIAKIKSNTRPAMATVRTESRSDSDIIVTAGFGAREKLNEVKALADSLGARLCATRKLVDQGYASYDAQIGLTGKTVSPPVYIAVGVSGAVHHIVGMQRSGTVIAINPDKDANIFEYADYGIIDEF